MKRKCFAKVNIFLKIAGKRDSYHELVSRFVRVHNLFDEIEFLPSQSTHFQLKGSFGCSLKQNTIYKAYELLKQRFPEVEEYFKHFKVEVKKNIPEFAGLGGGSSNAATFMLMVNEACNLCLTKDELAQLGAQIGADVPFFVYEYDSANVTGIGEIVKQFDEKRLHLEVYTPKVECDTGKIFKAFREEFYKEIKQDEAEALLEMPSKKVLESFDIKAANDLYEPACKANSKLKTHEKNGWYFSGSGSSFFRIID